MSSPDLELAHLVKLYGTTTAVDRIDLKVARGALLLPARPFGLRQDDDAADGGRP